MYTDTESLSLSEQAYLGSVSVMNDPRDEGLLSLRR